MTNEDLCLWGDAIAIARAGFDIEAEWFFDLWYEELCRAWFDPTIRQGEATPDAGAHKGADPGRPPSPAEPS